MNAIGQRSGLAQDRALSGAAISTGGGTWLVDIRGSMQGAGGVGGMVLWSRTHDSGANWSHFFPCYDGNGNVTELLDANGDIAAHWQYDPFGNTVASSPAPVNWASPVAWFPYRFSTKPLDFDTGLYYYGYRWYDPVTGRWPSRDPIGERGGINLYGFVGNDEINQWDFLGKKIEPPSWYDSLANQKNEEFEAAIATIPDPIFPDCHEPYSLEKRIIASSRQIFDESFVTTRYSRLALGLNLFLSDLFNFTKGLFNGISVYDVYEVVTIDIEYSIICCVCTKTIERPGFLNRLSRNLMREPTSLRGCLKIQYS